MEQNRKSDAESPGSRSPVPVPLEVQDQLPQWLQDKLSQAPSARGVLLNVLSHLNSRVYALSTHLPRHLVRELLSEVEIKTADAGDVEGDAIHGTLLFCDVSGFTALSERLAESGGGGIERLTGVLNDYFQRMLDMLAWSDGILLKFAGDAMLAYFAAQPDHAQAAWAVRAALRMMRSMCAFSTIATPVGAIELRMKIGVATGTLHAVHVGSPRRMDYVILGDVVARTMSAEGHAEAGEVIVDAATRAAYPQSQYEQRAPGFYAAALETDAALDGFEIRPSTQRRERRMALWMADTDEILNEIGTTWDQVRTLSAYLPKELVGWLQTGPQSGDHSENRPTAVIFVNVSGFRRLLHVLSPEVAAAQFVYGLFDDYYRMVHRIVSEYEGIISRVDPYKDGSKVLILFGAPQAHEDDAGRAVRAALAMRQELLRLNRQWEQRLRREFPNPADRGPLIQQRTGITYGVTFAGQVGSATRKEYTVMGDDVNLAARLMAAAEPGQILLSQAVHNALATHDAASQVETTPLSPIKVKGKTEPVVVYQANGISKSNGDRMPNRSAPLIGREVELKRAWRAVKEILDDDSVQLTILGEAGIGKSHFVQTLSNAAGEHGIRVLTTYCTAFGAGPYAPWVRLLQHLLTETAAETSIDPTKALHMLLGALDIQNPDHAQPLFQLLQLPYSSPSIEPEKMTPKTSTRGKANAPPSLFAQLGQKAEADQRAQPKKSLWQLTQNRRQEQRSPESGGWGRLDQRIATRAQTRLFESVSTLVGRLSGQGPVMIVFENAQWIDHASRDLLHYVIQASGGQPVAIVIVERTMEVCDLGHCAGTIVVLEPLSLDTTGDLVGSLLGETTPADELRRLASLVYEKSQGNPLVVEELATWYRSHQDSVDMASALRASYTVYELVMSRVDQLAPEQRAILRCAAVLGDGFTDDDLTVILSASIEESAIRRALADLVQDNVLISRKVESKVRLSFRKTRVREIIYESLPLSQRQAWHRGMAFHLEVQHAKNPSSVAELLASHHLGAGQWKAAAHYLILGADKAKRHRAYDQARSGYRRALETINQIAGPDGLGTLQHRALEGLADVALMKEHFADAIAHYRQAIRSIKALAQDELTQRTEPTLIKLALAHAGIGDWESAEDRGRQAWETCPDNRAHVAAATLAWVVWHRGSPEVEGWRQRARDLAAKAPPPESEIIHKLMDGLDSTEGKIIADKALSWASHNEAHDGETPNADRIIALFHVLERSGHQEA